jgi:serine phosphatase RsbU (regulator of sigma subunit)
MVAEYCRFHLLIDHDHLCFAIGDVSGKGVPAALFMAVTKTLIKATSSRGIAPGEILTRVNRELSQGNEACKWGYSAKQRTSGAEGF